MTTNANPNGSIAIVFTYSGTTLGNYQNFLDQFHITLPGGDGVLLGTNQCYGYTPGTSQFIELGTSYPMNNAASPITELLPINAAGNKNLEAAFKAWTTAQAASPGATQYANLYLDHFTGGRIYLSNGDLKLAATGEPVPASPADKNTYDLVYELIEPYIGAQVNSTDIPGNGVDITDIDWFSFPITIKVWYYNFSDTTSKTLTNDVEKTTTIERGGDGPGIYATLKVGDVADPGTNQYPNKTLHVDPSGADPRRVAGPTAAATSGYYTDPAKDLFPYHYFDTYLRYLASEQGSAASSFTLSGAFAGTGDAAIDKQAQQFKFDVDFSDIRTQTQNYAGGSVKQITPDSTIRFRGHTFTDDDGNIAYVLGSPTAPLTIELPWAKGTSTASFRISGSDDALANGWLSQAATQTAPSGTYTPVDAIARDSQGNKIPTLDGAVTQLKLIFSVNEDPGTLDDLWQGGKGAQIKVTGATGLKLIPGVFTHASDQQGAAIEIKAVADAAGANGRLESIGIHDAGGPSKTGRGSTWTFPANTPNLNNNQLLKIELLADPPLRNAYVLASASYAEAPASLDLPLHLLSGATQTDSLNVEAAGMAPLGWDPATDWATLNQPAGIYGANTGYTISGITGTNSSLNRDVKSLQNDVFGWVIADMLAALNVGFVGSPALVPGTTKTIGQSPQAWFDKDIKLYSSGLWGEKAWQDANGQAVQFAGEPVTNFWNTWAYKLSTVAGGTDAYGFAFTDRFAEAILLPFNPPSASPSDYTPVLVEVIVGDSPLLPASTK